jgi:hypothetical protein
MDAHERKSGSGRLALLVFHPLRRQLGHSLRQFDLRLREAANAEMSCSACTRAETTQPVLHRR